MKRLHSRWTYLLVPALLAVPAGGRKFYADDPVWREPAPRPVENPKGRKLSEFYDFFLHTFFSPHEKQSELTPIAAQGVNTLGEVPDSGWYVNRHGLRPMTIEELVRGPGNDRPPAAGTWKVVAAKTEGVTPGFMVEDSAGRRYFLKFDPATNPEMASAADVIGAKFFHALGYHVPENYIVYFQSEQLEVANDAKLRDASGRHRRMTGRDVTDLLVNVPYDERKGYRAIASLYLAGRPLGPFRYFGTRRDDPNDIVPHEHRRDLRGLFVFSAWLGHNDVKALNTLDMLVNEDGVPYIRHHLIDFGASLGSDSFTAKSPRAGNQYLFAWKPAAREFFTLGLAAPQWTRAHYPNIPSVGRFEYRMFEPERWKPNYPTPAFDNRLPEDNFWAAKQVMTFTDEQIRAIVKTGEYSDPKAEEWLSRCLIERRNKIGRTYFAQVLPLDRFVVEGGRLQFVDLAVKHGFAPATDYEVRWHRFDNETERKERLDGETSLALPAAASRAAAGEYFAAEIRAADPEKKVTVYLRREADDFGVVGIEREPRSRLQGGGKR